MTPLENVRLIIKQPAYPFLGRLGLTKKKKQDVKYWDALEASSNEWLLLVYWQAKHQSFWPTSLLVTGRGYRPGYYRDP